MITSGQTIKIREKSKENQIVLQAQQSPRLDVPEFLLKETNFSGTLQAIPGIDAIPFSFDSGLFTEYYAARKV